MTMNRRWENILMYHDILIIVLMRIRSNIKLDLTAQKYLLSDHYFHSYVENIMKAF